MLSFLHVSFRLFLNQQLSIYYFDLSHEQFLDVTQGDRRVRLKLDFVDVVAEKRLDLIVNGKLRSLETKELSYSIDLSDEVVQGTNAVKVKPRKTIDIRELRVDFIK